MWPISQRRRTVSSSNHHAAGPTLGYLYQVQQALLRLVPHALADDEAAVRLEVFDDVSFHRGSGPARDVLQIHHSVNSDRELLDTSAKTWRTLAIWTAEWKTLHVDERREMLLVTTQLARAGSGLEKLTARIRDPEEAHRILFAIATDLEGAKGTAKDRAVFAALPEDDRRELLARVTVADRAPAATRMRDELVAGLMPAHQSDYVPSIAKGVEGWWWGRAVDALVDREPITATELRAVIDEERRGHLDGRLPIRSLDSFDSADLPDVDSDAARFVACLNAIRAQALHIETARDDYLRAAAHRSYWLRELLVGPGELSRYDSSLVAEWGLRSLRAFTNLTASSSDDENATAGLGFYEELILDSRSPLRVEVPDVFVQRGSYHALADDQRVGWHPTEVRRIQGQSVSRQAA